MTLPVDVGHDGKLLVIVIRKEKELNILVKPSSYRTLMILVKIQKHKWEKNCGRKAKKVPLSTVDVVEQGE